ncbi:MAG: histidine phosphatase family protein [Bacilli bacterium]|nr:histidine phosphatase family protein [Bacilli bacterium]
MKTIFLVANNLVVDNINYISKESVDERRAKRPLSAQGEKAALKLAKIKGLDCVSNIYSSEYASAISTAKYLSSRLEIPLNIDKNLNERKIGNFPDGLKLSYYKDSQEHDFNYKLPGGETINDTKKRITAYMKNILSKSDDYIAIFTHQIAITSFLLNYCEASYNLDDHLILNYKDKVVSNFNSLVIYKLVYDDELRLLDIKTY